MNENPVLIRILFALVAFLVFLWIILPFVLFSMHRQLTKLIATMTNVLGVLELTRRTTTSIDETTRQQGETAQRIERIQSTAHHIKFED